MHGKSRWWVTRLRSQPTLRALIRPVIRRLPSGEVLGSRSQESIGRGRTANRQSRPRQLPLEQLYSGSETGRAEKDTSRKPLENPRVGSILIGISSTGARLGRGFNSSVLSRSLNSWQRLRTSHRGVKPRAPSGGRRHAKWVGFYDHCEP
jgi:hypothetical protein